MTEPAQVWVFVSARGEHEVVRVVGSNFLLTLFDYGRAPTFEHSPQRDDFIACYERAFSDEPNGCGGWRRLA